MRCSYKKVNQRRRIMTKSTSVAAAAQVSTPARRAFMIGSGVAAVGAIGAAVVTQTGPRAVKTSKATVPAGLGYQETAHVREYYRTAQI
jgi:hypothetical protein